MKRSLLALGVSISALTSAPAWPQSTTAAPPVAADGVAASSAEAIAQDNGEAPEGDIVVTANRETSLLSRTPAALTALTGDTLIQAGITSPTALADLTPNVAIQRDNAPAAGGGLQITIRGVTSTDATEKGDPSAAFLRDGIYIARPQAQDVSFFDLARVEVLRGPQGTLYGRNTTAGVVNVISARPAQRFEVSGLVGYGSFGSLQATGVVNLPLSDWLAVRAAVNLERRDNVVETSVSRIDIDPSRNNRSIRLSALADLASNVSLYLQADYSVIKGSPFAVVPVTNFFRGPFTADTTPIYFDSSTQAQRTTSRIIPWREYRDNRDRGVMGEFNWDFGPAKLTWLASYREFERDERRHAGPTASFRSTFDGTYRQHSEEARLAFGGSGWWRAQVGAFYFRETSKIDTTVIEANRRFVQNPTVSESKAAFGQTTLTLAEGLNLTGGVRYSHDDKSRTGAITAETPVRTIVQVNDAKRSFSRVTWRGGVDYDVRDLGLVYGSMSTGYKAGGFNDGCQVGSGPTCTLSEQQLYYEPETLTAYEVGFKWRLGGRALRLNGAAFHYDYNNLQLSQASFCAGINCSITSNAARAKIDGVELEAIIRPADAHQVDLGLNWLDARYADFMPTATVSFAGQALSRAPRWSWFAGYTYTRVLGGGQQLSANVRTRFSDRYDLTDLATRVHFYQPSFTKTDATITFAPADEAWNLQLFAKNLENAMVLTFARNSAGAEAAFEDPRTLGVRATFKF